MSTRMSIVLMTAAAAVLATARADAFQIETVVTTGCHERISLAALRASGWPDGAEPPAPSEDQRRAIDDLPFELPAEARDPWTMSLLVGARHNDIEDANPADLPAIAAIHNRDGTQPEHCLRRRSFDGPAGDAEARAACKAFVLAELEAALGPGADVDLDALEDVEVYLAFRGAADVPLQRYAFHLGRALHALQDGYTHAFRNPQDARVRHVLNWIEGNIGDSYAIERDGHWHMDVLDDCASSAGGTERRERWATEASTELIAAVADPGGGRAGRIARASDVLDRRLDLEPDCIYENDWCGAPEPALAGGCATTGATGGLWLALAAVITLCLRRRPPLLLSMLLLAASPAAADSNDTGEATDEQAEQEVDAQERVIDSFDDPVSRTWGLALTGGAAFDRAAASAGVGVRFNPWERVGLGLDVEYNPWFSLSAAEAAPGVANAYVPVHVSLKRFGSWELRTTFKLGATLLLFDLVGVDRGTVGPYLGWNPLGLAIPVGGSFKLIVEPGDIAVPMPQVEGIPYYYHQYRTTIALEWYPR